MARASFEPGASHGKFWRYIEVVKRSKKTRNSGQAKSWRYFEFGVIARGGICRFHCIVRSMLSVFEYNCTLLATALFIDWHRICEKKQCQMNLDVDLLVLNRLTNARIDVMLAKSQ